MAFEKFTRNASKDAYIAALVLEPFWDATKYEPPILKQLSSIVTCVYMNVARAIRRDLDLQSPEA